MKLSLCESGEGLLKSAQTGWILLFSGTSWGALATQYYGWTDSSHVALIIRPLPGDQLYEQLGCTSTGDEDGVTNLFIWEVVRHSDAECFDLVTCQQRKEGARLVRLMERLQNSRQQRFVRIVPMHFTCLQRFSSDTERRKRLNNVLLNFMVQHRNTQFDDSWLTLFRAEYNGPYGENDRNCDDRVFCSDGVARALQQCALLHLTKNTREIAPSTFERCAISDGENSDDTLQRPSSTYLIDCEFEKPILLAEAVALRDRTLCCTVMCGSCVLL